MTLKSKRLKKNKNTTVPAGNRRVVAGGPGRHCHARTGGGSAGRLQLHICCDVSLYVHKEYLTVIWKFHYNSTHNALICFFFIISNVKQQQYVFMKKIITSI